MKKMDFVMIILVLLIGVSVFTVYFKKYNVKIEDAKVEIYFQNVLIESVDMKEDINYTFTLETIDNNTLRVTKEQNGNITITNLSIPQKKEIYNKLIINNDEVKMIEANCDSKICLDMRLNRKITIPIICTNGVAAMLVANEGIEVVVP